MDLKWTVSMIFKKSKLRFTQEPGKESQSFSDTGFYSNTYSISV